MPSNEMEMFAWLQRQQGGFNVCNVVSVMLHTLSVHAVVSHSLDKQTNPNKWAKMAQPA